jgi:wyosine [tRNA(Phe)-imidazoG37] synthetase (radical SAM superfamily)
MTRKDKTLQFAPDGLMNIERPTSNIEWEKMKKQIHEMDRRGKEGL